MPQFKRNEADTGSPEVQIAQVRSAYLSRSGPGAHADTARHWRRARNRVLPVA